MQGARVRQIGSFKSNLLTPPAVKREGHSCHANVLTDKSSSRLFVRALDSLEAIGVAGTEGAKQPFWSPDSKWVGFFARGKLVKVALAGGAPVAIADAPDGRGPSS